MNRDLLTIISQMSPQFSKGQRLIANYIVNHFDKAAFMTAFKLGTTVGVSESTVVRFASEVGFSGYPELQKALQELIRNKLTTVQRMDVTSDQLENGNVLARVLGKDIEKIRRTLEETSERDFAGAVDAICSAKTIYIIGVRSSSALATFLSFYFNHIFSDVRLINTYHADRGGGCVHRFQLPALFQTDGAGGALCPRKWRKGYRADRHRESPDCRCRPFPFDGAQ